MRKLLINLTFLLLAATITSNAVEVADKSTFANPMLWADVPDPDVIRVGDDFYMVSTTMHLMPGCPIMRSKDLVNWEVISYVFDTLDDNSRYRLIDGNVYGRGQWATSLKYHNGRFYVLFSPNDQPYRSYIYSTADPTGKWELVSRTPHFHDSSLLFDDDGRVYVYSGTGNLRELNPDLSDVKEGGVDMVIFERDSTETGLLEGSRALKLNGKYYLLMISWPNGKPRRQVCYRADKITGPYEKKVILQSEFGGFPYAGQGTIVDDAKGNWWGVIFQDRGGVGRVLTLMPCRWIDGWPILGDENGKIPAVMERPVAGCPDKKIVTSDDFDSDKLNINWQWNHCPVNEAWSLTDRPGHLRLTTSRVVDNLYNAPNTISQRMEGPECNGAVKIDVSHMKDGDVAGFGAFNGHSGLLSIEKNNGKTELVMHTNVVKMERRTKNVLGVDNEEIQRVALNSPVVMLRINADFRPGRDIARFAYSTDGKSWNEIGRDFKMRFDYQRLFMGTRFAIYNYATREKGGYVDVDYFNYERLSDDAHSMSKIDTK